MSAFSFLLNLLWILFGGLWMAAGWVIAAIFMAITVIGLPWTRAAFYIAAYTLLPFGQKVVSRAVYSGREDIGTGPLGVVGNLAWLVASTRPSYYSIYPCPYNHRHPFCLGACEAGCTGSLANRQDNCTSRGRATSIRGPGLRRIFPLGLSPNAPRMELPGTQVGQSGQHARRDPLFPMHSLPQQPKIAYHSLCCCRASCWWTITQYFSDAGGATPRIDGLD